jgi:Fic family protein
VAALLAWHAAATGGESGLRTAERSREDGPPPAPAEFVRSRLEILERWINMPSARELKPGEAGALVLARIIEILPFDDGNGRVARLAASHLMVRAGGRPPVLVAGDALRLRQTIGQAMSLVTEPLATLLDEASERALDIMIQTLQRS